MLHVAPLSSHYWLLVINNIDISEAMMMDGVIDVITGAEIGAAIQPLMNGLDTPKVQRFPLAVNRVRYAGEWVCAVVAETRAIAEDARKNYHRRYPQPFILDAEEALLPSSHQCIRNMAAICFLIGNLFGERLVRILSMPSITCHLVSYGDVIQRSRSRPLVLSLNGMDGIISSTYRHRFRCQNTQTKLRAA